MKATDDDSELRFSTLDVTVTVTNVDEKPRFGGTPSTAITQEENKPASAVLADYDTRDAEGSTIYWILLGEDKNDFSITSDGILTFKSSPDFEDPTDSDLDNVYSFMVTANDENHLARISLTVTVMDLEETGTISVENHNPTVGDELAFTLTDPDGGVVTTGELLTWLIRGRPPGGPWELIGGVGNNSTDMTFTVPAIAVGKEMRAEVSYTDRRGPDKSAVSAATNAVTATRIANAPPRFLGDGAFTIPEGAAGRNVGTPLRATDRDDDRLTYGIDASAGNADFFEINSSTGQLRLAKAVDYETRPAGGKYSVSVTLHDGKDSNGTAETDAVVDATLAVSVEITDVEEDGAVTLSSEEPETGTELTATLADADGSVTAEMWRWDRSRDGRTGWVNIAGATTSAYTPGLLDGHSYLRARVEYTDNRGAGKRAAAVTDVRAPCTNRPPFFQDDPEIERIVYENEPAGVNIEPVVVALDPEGDRLTYSLTSYDDVDGYGEDVNFFSVNSSTGQIRTKRSLDSEEQLVRAFNMNVHDGRDARCRPSTAIDDKFIVLVTVRDLDEKGTVTLSSPPGSTIQAQVEATATMSEPDCCVRNVRWRWSHSSNGRTDRVHISGANVSATASSGEFISTFTPSVELQSRFLHATAFYIDKGGPGKVAFGVSPRPIAGPPPPNSAPVFPATETGQREVDENSSPGTTIGAPVAAFDLNAGDATVNDDLAYSLSGSDAASFTIDPSTGQISLGQDTALDYETRRTYRVTVQVTDGRDRNGADDNDAIDDRINVTINVTDVNEAPVVSGDTEPSIRENTNRAVATYTATDPERDNVTWSVEGVNADDFWISDRGQFYFLVPPSFEDGATRTVSVIATDPGGESGSQRRDRDRGGRGGARNRHHHAPAGLGRHPDSVQRCAGGRRRRR